MKNLRIGVRLGLGFCIVVLLIAAIAVTGINRIHVIGDAMHDILENRAPKIEACNEVSKGLNDVARASRTMLLVTEKKDLDLAMRSVADGRKRAGDNMAELEKTVKHGKGLELLSALKEASVKYVGHLDRFLKLFEEGKKTEALALLVGDMRGAQWDYDTALNNLKKYEQAQMKQGMQKANDAEKLAVYLMFGFAGLATLISVLVAFFTTRSITLPMKKAVEVAQTVASGDLTSNITVSSRDETGQLMQALKDMNDSLLKIVGNIRVSSETISTASAQIATGNMDLSSRTEQQASSLEETASSMEELTSTVRQNADNALQANQLAVSASEVAVKGGEVVSQVVQTMGAINESSRKIAEIIGVIDGIAFQTNILALNAAVEAARAGEQGRGFAVVATEVRNLAQRSAAAAREIKSLIDDSVIKVGEGSRLVGQAGTTMEEVVSSIKRVHDIMSEITAASREQSDGIEQVNQAVMQMDQVTQQNAALVEEAAAAAESMQEQSTQLMQEVSAFRTGQQAAAPAPAARKPLTVAQVRKPTPAARQTKPAPVARLAPPNRPPKGTDEEWEQF